MSFDVAEVVAVVVGSVPFDVAEVVAVVVGLVSFVVAACLGEQAASVRNAAATNIPVTNFILSP
ncbi:hypothetical protein D1872_245850 [compost metagenome]